MPVSSIAQGGLIAAETQFNHAASQIAAAAIPSAAPQGDSVSLSQSNINLLAAKESLSANLGLLKTDDAMTKRILDMLG